ncbi:hypothetical protein V6N13_063732 [Hibiscus sabdariffa]
MEESFIGGSFVWLYGRWTQEAWSCGVLGMYAPCNVEGQCALWNDIRRIVQAGRHPWCIVGDFNVVRTVEERQGMVSLARGMCEFNEFIEDLDLVDLPLKGHRFTWFGSGNKCSRLDRFLLSVEWLEHFPGLVQVSLPRGISDHVPLSLVLDETDWGPKPFRFINAWVDNPRDVQRMGIEWGKLSESFATGDVLSKFRAMRQFLQVWNAKEFGSIDDQIECYELLLDGLDDRVARGEVEDNVADERRELLDKVWQFYRLRESLWRQKSQALWLRQGDRNTRFFHRAARLRGMRSYLGYPD